MRRFIGILVLTALPFSSGIAQETGKTLAATLDVFVFPTEGQAADQQSKDEAECYSWAADRTGTDPFELDRQAREQMAASDQAMAQAQSAGQGSTGRGAATGAVAGGVIGGIFGKGRKSGLKGAAAGAATGALIGSSSRRKAQAGATEQVASQSANAQAATQAQLDDFRTAFTTCLEAKDYIAKF